MEISALTNPNRVEIFKHLAVTEPDRKINMRVFNSILGDNYNSFLGFCDQVFEERSRIRDISCTVRGTRCKFNIEYNG